MWRIEQGPEVVGSVAPWLRVGCLALAVGLPCTASMGSEVVGWVEKVKVYPGDVTVKAKIDTGAAVSSLHCVCQMPFEKDGKQWVAFTVEGADGTEVRLERPVVRVAKVKRHYGEMQERMVVRLGVCLAGTYRDAEVNLIDRRGLNYPMLIGRSFLSGDFLVDPGATFLTTARCKPPAASEQ